MRKTLREYGSHGRSVRVFVESFASRNRQSLVRVQWREAGKLRTESLPDSRENQARAKAFAEGVAERLTLHGRGTNERLTMMELGERYLAAHPTPETWRPRTRQSFIGRWKVWLAFATPTRQIDTVTPDTLDDFRAAMRQQDYAVNQIANHVQLVKSVYRFARARKYLLENPIAEYAMKLSRDQRRLEVPEWTAEERDKILAALDPRSARTWRAYCAVVLSAVLGVRVNALLNLEWRDVDVTARVIRWRPELDKLAKDRTQPMPRDAVRAVRILRVWRGRLGYAGPFVIPGDKRRQKRAGGERPYSYQALNQSLKHAATVAQVRWIDYRALHGFRRHVLNNALAITGNIVRAGQFIGDTDLRTLQRSYVRERAEDLRDVADAMTLPRTERNQTVTEPSNRRSPKRQETSK